MKIELKEITVRELTDGYEDNDEAGVVGYGRQTGHSPPLPEGVSSTRTSSEMLSLTQLRRVFR